MTIQHSKINDFFATHIKRGSDGREYQPDGCSIRLDEALELQKLITEFRPTHTMEIGLALGASAIAISESLEQCGTAVKHVVLDPFQSQYGDVGLRELERLGLRHRVEFLEVFSYDFLYDCSKRGRRFDLIFNDGGHSIGIKVTDAFLSDQCLTAGGLIAFHDAFMFSVTAAVKYLVKNQGYEVIKLIPDSRLKRWLRVIKYGTVYGWWYGNRVVPFTARSLVVLRKPS